MRPEQSVLALEWTNFFLADVQAGLGPFVAAYLAGLGWTAGAIGEVLTVAGIITVALQTPAGWLVDHISHKRQLLITATLALAAGALLLGLHSDKASVYTAQILVGCAAPFLGLTLAALTLNVVGRSQFDHQFGRNQGFNAAGNLFTALMIALISHFAGQRYTFYVAALLTLPTVAAVSFIRMEDVQNKQHAKGTQREAIEEGYVTSAPARQRGLLLICLTCAFLFHFANAAMLPQLGELLAQDSRQTAAPFMSACVAITQIVVLFTASFFGRYAASHGRRPLLLVAFGILPIRAALYALLTWTPALLAVQVLDGVANSIFGVVSILVIADLTGGTKHFNLAQGALGTGVGLGAAFSTVFGGTLMQWYGYRVSFFTLGGAAFLGFVLLLAGMRETASKPVLNIAMALE